MKFSRAVALHQEGSLIKKSGTRMFRVDKTFQWWIDYENKNERAIVPTGFVTDLGSIPRLLWFIFDPTKWISYVLHDSLYANKFLIQEDGQKRFITRLEADDIMYNALIVEGCGQVEAKFVYTGVRLLGWYRWNR